jgi:hypothetical protein
MELIGVGHCGPDGLCILLANVVYKEMAANASSKSGPDLRHERLGCHRDNDVGKNDESHNRERRGRTSGLY